MSERRAIFLPQTLTWLLRLGADASIASTFQQDPVAFAGWYATMGTALTWPEEVVAIQTTERNKKLSLDRMMKLLTQVNYAYAGRTTSDHARRVLEGYAVHDWVRHHLAEFMELAKLTLSVFDGSDSLRLTMPPRTSFAARLSELSAALGLSQLEQDIFSFSCLTSAAEDFAGIFEQLADDRWTAERLWTVCFKTTREELSKALRVTSPLRLSGLLQSSGRRSQLAAVSNFWLELLSREENLFDVVLEPQVTKLGSGMPARLQDDDKALATSVLKNAQEPGVNLLLYGAASLEKRHLVRDIVSRAERTAFRVRKFEEASRADVPALTFVAFELLKQRSEPSVLVVERPADVLQTAPSSFIRALFGIELSNEDIPPFDEHLLTTNSVPGLWLAADAASLPDDTLARFVFHAPLKKAGREERLAAVQERLAGLKLGRKATEEILKLEGVSSAQLEAAVKAARLLGAKKKAARDDAIVQAVRRSQKALSRDVKAKTKPSVTKYSLKYINAAGRFGPDEILQAFKRRPKGALVLYGPPGTGKTQYVEYLAQELGMPLISKRASELLNKFIGETEKNIFAAFEEASTEEGILLLDEGDSFFRSRENAQQSWEVTQVNEMLQAVERFDGIVVVCTNLFKGLDPAALRRFTFKVEFRPLNPEQRWEMFVNEANLETQLTSLGEPVRANWRSRLLAARDLTAGDFATVKRQCDLLGLKLSPREWLEQLEIECNVRAGTAG